MIRFSSFGKDSLSATPSNPELQDLPWDLITFLAIAQKLKISFLPITWQPALSEAGEGGTAKIHQSLVNLRMTFAFKVFKNARWIEKIDENQRPRQTKLNFQACIAEISVLGHPSVHEHPNIISLFGICWDILPSGRVWPVLVFERTPLGDLGSFINSEAGRTTPFEIRIKLCADIAVAVRDLHQSRIIHGDIKPQNILIFKDGSGAYVAKVADFGYSTVFTGSGGIKMPRSEPWTAPEWIDGHEFALSEARKMDTYSFGMLCLWFLFNEAFLTMTEVPCNRSKLEDDELPFTELYEGALIPKLLLESKFKNNMLALTNQVMTMARLDDEYMSSLARFFHLTLVHDPAKRCSDFNQFLHLLGQNRVVSSPTQRVAKDQVHLLETEFRVVASMIQLYQADCRVRSQIRLNLRERVSNFLHQPSCKVLLKNAAFQLAFCYRIGFGIAKDIKESQFLVEQSMRPLRELESEVDLVKRGLLYSPVQAGAFKRLLHQGYVLTLDLAQHYREHQQLNQIDVEYKREISDTESVLGDEHLIVVMLKSALSKIYSNQGRLQEAEELKLQVMKIRKRILGQGHPDTLRTMNDMALLHWNQGRWEQAEELQLQVMSIKQTLRQDHPFILNSMSSLAAILWSQGRWKEAQKLQVQVMRMTKKVFGNEHPKTLNVIGNLAASLWNQGKWRRATNLEQHVMKISNKVLGPEHPHTLNAMRNLALTYTDQGQWKRAKELQTQVMDLSNRVLGDNHPDTLTNMTNLAASLYIQGRWNEAKDLESQALQIKERVLGQEHPSTLTSMANLAATLWNLGLWKEADALKTKVMNKSNDAFGAEHPDTLISMGNLAVTYRGQGQWEKAEKLLLKVIEVSNRVLGHEHSFTITSKMNLAAVFLDQKRWKEAEKLTRKVVQWRQRMLGHEHPQTLTSVTNLAAILGDQQQWKVAERLEVQVIETSKRVLGQGHPDTLIRMANLAVTYQSQGRLTEAKELHQKTLELRHKVLGIEHLDTLSSKEHLAAIYRDQKSWKDAEKLMIQVMQTREKLLGSEHPDTLTSMANVASLYRCRARWNDAEKLQIQVVGTRVKLLGQEHPDTLTSMANLASTYVGQGRLTEAKELHGKTLGLRRKVLGDGHSDTVISLEWVHFLSDTR